jgi:hypothetical protein
MDGSRLRPLYRCESCGAEGRSINATLVLLQHRVKNANGVGGRWCGPMVRVPEHDPEES